MRSGRRRSRPDADTPVFFLDRGLGINFVATAIREAGYVALSMVEIYPRGRDQEIGDDEWIARASAEGWIALTKDASLARRHSAALERSTLRVFALSNATLTGPAMAQRYRQNLNRIVARAKRPGPYLYVVTSTGLEHRWPPLPAG